MTDKDQDSNKEWTVPLLYSRWNQEASVDPRREPINYDDPEDVDYHNFTVQSLIEVVDELILLTEEQVR